VNIQLFFSLKHLKILFLICYIRLTLARRTYQRKHKRLQLVGT